MEYILNGLALLTATPSGGEGGQGSILPTLITFGLIFLIFYFLIIRPQNKRQKDTKQMLATLRKGDRVSTIGGIRGVVQSLKDDTVVLKVSNDVTLEFNRAAVSAVVDRKEAGAKSPAPKAVAEKKPASGGSGGSRTRTSGSGSRTRASGSGSRTRTSGSGSKTRTSGSGSRTRTSGSSAGGGARSTKSATDSSAQKEPK